MPLTNFTTRSETISALAKIHNLHPDLQILAYATYYSTPLFIAVKIPYKEKADNCVLLDLSDSLARNKFLADCGAVYCKDCPLGIVCSGNYSFRQHIDQLLPNFRSLFPEYFL